MPAATQDTTTGRFVAADQQPPKPDAAAEAAAAAAAAPKEPTIEQKNALQALSDDLFDVPEEERKPAEKAPEKPAKPAKPAVTKPATKKPAAAAPAPARLTEEQIAAAAAEGATRALAAAKPKADDTKPLDEPDLPPEASKRIPVLERMAKINPEKYKGVVEDYRKYFPQLKAYIDKWETEHPGQEFNEDDAEHNDWYAANEPEWVDDDYMEAQADIRADLKVAEQLKPVNEKLSAYEAQKKIEEAQPKIVTEQVHLAREYWKMFGEEFAKLIGDDGQVDIKKFNELAESDPVPHSIRLRAANALNAETDALYKTLNGLEKFDEKNEVHMQIDAFARQMETDLLAQPELERNDAKGRAYLTSSDYWAKWRRNKSDTESRFWTLGLPENLRDIMTARAAVLSQNAVKLIEAEEKKFESMAKARGFQKGGNAEVRQQAKPPEEEEPVLTEDGRPVSPSAGDAPKVAARTAAAGAQQQDALSRWLSD